MTERDPNTINIPTKCDGYTNLSTKIIKKPQDLRLLLLRIQRHHKWEGKREFLSIMSNTIIDFRTHDLLLLRHDENSSSTKVDARLKVRRSTGEVSVIVERDVVANGTHLMAYYCFAFLIPKNAGRSVSLDERKTKKYIYTVC